MISTPAGDPMVTTTSGGPTSTPDSISPEVIAGESYIVFFK